MLRCYFIALCQSSALDRDTNRMSAFNFVERIGYAPPHPGTVPLEVHTYWCCEPDEIGLSFEYYVARVPHRSGAEEPGPIIQLTMASTIVRNRSGGFVLPSGPGQYDLCISWRIVGTMGWVRGSHFWPLTLELMVPTGGGPQP
jgi:hypothetical protein